MKSSGAVLIVTKNGLISSNIQVLWIASDRYKVIYRQGERANIEDRLETIRGTVAAGSFIPDQYPKISLIKAHQQAVGARSSCKKRSCGCKGGNCGARCGCIKAGLACNSSCSCWVNVKRKEKNLLLEESICDFSDCCIIIISDSSLGWNCCHDSIY